MIYINRRRRDETGKLIRPSAGWYKKARAATRTALQEQGAHVAAGNVYAHDEVRAALEKLFHEKCAYCESSLEEVGWNVEHYRPKGRVAKSPNHPGYYWLAYEWANLYPSCVPCNQRRKDKPCWDDMRTGVASGKADQFPLADETKRAMSHEDPKAIEKEEPLLIDPCRDDPSKFLAFVSTGKALGIDRDPRGEATIRICNLNRKRLRRKRHKAIERMLVLRDWSNDMMS